MSAASIFAAPSRSPGAPDRETPRPASHAFHSAATTPDPTSIAEWIQRIRAEYLEIPGLHLTRNQVQRLWGLDSVTCDTLLAALVDVSFLKRTHAGAYVRADNSVR